MESLQLFVSIFSTMLVTILMALVAVNAMVVTMSVFHKRQLAMRILAHFSRAISLLRLSDAYHPSKPDNQINNH